MRENSLKILPLAGLIACLISSGAGIEVVSGATHPAVAPLSSRPGAAYTIYLDFGGFTYSGNWANNASYSPGTTPAYDNTTVAFSVTDAANIKNIWSRVAEKYSVFDVNVTTVDPAAGNSDPIRQNFYDGHAQMMHTVIGGLGAWTGGNFGGISNIGVTAAAQPGNNGAHTNWLFAQESPSNLQFISDGSAHENGHGLGLNHQSDYNGNTLVNEYSLGTGTGAGSRAPIMGDSYSTERGLWGIGTAHVGNAGPTIQNDVQIIANDPSMGGFINDGVSHSMATATPIPMIGNTIDFSNAKGIITPSNSASPATDGLSNYVSDFWSFSTAGGITNLAVNAGREFINPGFADPGAMLDSSLELFNSNGKLIRISTTASLSEAVTINLAPGGYTLVVLSAANPNFDATVGARNYYDMGSYFLTGTINVPEPAVFGLSLYVLIRLAGRRPRRRVG